MKQKRREAVSMKFRRASTLTVSFEGSAIVVYNFITKQKLSCSPEGLEFISRLDEWRSAKQIFHSYPDTDPMSLSQQILKLIEYGAIIVKGTLEAERDEKYRQTWLWGVAAGLYHFSVRDTPFITGAPARLLMRKRKALRRSPRLIESNTNMHKVIKLPATDVQKEPFRLMRRRRSRRKFDGTAMSLQSLSDCLFAGNGIVEMHTDKLFGQLPLAMTPSGGARNPFELYVYASRVVGLTPGFYHYGALQHDLGLVRSGRVAVPPMLGTQKWPAKAAAIIFLVAHFPRSMWKYHMPIAYRVVMMEAGFIGQNIALAATHHGFSAVPSGALKNSLIEEYLGIEPVESGAVLSLSLGRPLNQKD